MNAALTLAVLALSGTLSAADLASLEAGKKAEVQACVPCHSLRLIHSQRLSKAAWDKEINKMVGWGAVVPDRQILLDYLSAEYSDAKPVPAPDLSASEEKHIDKAGK